MIQYLINQMMYLFRQGNFAWGYQIYKKILESIQKKGISEVEKARMLNEIAKRLEFDILKTVSDVEKWPLIANMTALCFQIMEEIGDLFSITSLGINIIQVLTRNKMAKSEVLAEFIDDLIAIMVKAKNYRIATESLFASIIFKTRLRKDRIIAEILNKYEQFLEKLNPDDSVIVTYCMLINSFRMVISDPILIGDNQQLSQFISTVYRMIGDIMGNYARESLTKVNMMVKQNQDIFSNHEYIENLLQKLFLIKEFDWTFTIFQSYYNYLKKLQIENAAFFEYVNIYIEKAVKFGGSRVAFDAYQLASKLIDFGQDFHAQKASLWLEASEVFKNLKDQHLFVGSIDFLKGSIRNPKTFEEINDFLRINDKLLSVQIGLVEPTIEEILFALIYRAVFEMKSYSMAEYFEKLLLMLIQTEDAMYSETNGVQKGMDLGDQEMRISKTIIEGKSQEFLAYLHMIVESIKTNEAPKPIKINPYDVIRTIIQHHESGISINTVCGTFEERATNTQVVIKETIPFDLLIKHRRIFAERFPYVFYLLLPVSLRNYFNSMKSEKNVYHEVYFVSNTSGFNPFEYCADLDGSFIQSISFGYHFGKFYEFPKFYLPKMRPLREIRILLIGNLNEHVPVSYNHKTKADEPAIKNHLLTESFRTIQFNLKAISNTIEIDVFNYSNGKRADIVEKLKQKSYNIIHIMNPLFFSETQPEKSYFITSDEQNLSIEQFQDAVESQIANRGHLAGQKTIDPLC